MSKKKELKITVGCDPEFFWQDVGGSFRYPIGVPGSKAAPFHVNDGAIQVDGLALELNIDPANNVEEFVGRCKSVFEQFNRYVSLNQIKIVASAEFPPNHLKQLSPHLTELGCVPDFNAYTGEANPRPNFGKDDAELTLRAAGGHIHLGWETKDVNILDTNHIANCYEVVKQLDYYIGVPSLLWDRDQKRRSLYGKAGACRIKPYGVEYRTPSNQWFKSEALQRFVFNKSIKAINDLYNGKRLVDVYGTRAQEMINQGRIPDESWCHELVMEVPEEYRVGTLWDTSKKRA